MNLTPVIVKGFFDVFKKKGYAFFTKGDYNLNIIGIRAYPGVVNKFDDLICLVYKVKDVWTCKSYPATTDPGLYYLNNPMNVSGTAILQEGQHRGAFKLGMHKNQYQAVVQYKNLPVYRDNNKDSKHDFNEKTIEKGMFGINIHRATATPGGESTQIDKWSAGCQVIASYNNFKEFMEIINKSAKLYGDIFTYTLINEKDFNV